MSLSRCEIGGKSTAKMKNCPDVQRNQMQYLIIQQTNITNKRVIYI